MDSKIYLAGHMGMVGSAIVRALKARGRNRVVTRTREELDLSDQHAVRSFFDSERPEQVILAAARVGGIHANNTYPAEFIYQNLMIEANVIHEAWRSGVDKLLFLGSSCIYPRQAPQPMTEKALLTGELEPTNEPYAIAKITGIKMCESYNRQYGVDFRSVMPTNLYGPGDNFHIENSHVIPGLMRRFHQAMTENAPRMLVWGTGRVKREFLHVDDMADAALHVFELDKARLDQVVESMCSHLNIGSGTEISIGNLATTIAEIVGYEGEIEFDAERPEGPPVKSLDSSRLKNLGWEAKTELRSGLTSTYEWFRQNITVADR